MCVEPERPVGEEGYRLFEVEGIKVYVKEGIDMNDNRVMIYLDKFIWLKKLRVLGLTAG